MKKKWYKKWCLFVIMIALSMGVWGAVAVPQSEALVLYGA